MKEKIKVVEKPILKRGEFACAPLGERIAVSQDPPTEVSRSGILHIPVNAQLRPYTGRILAAGLTALDKMYDHGALMGDQIWFGKFAGVVEEWDHMTTEHVDCPFHVWSRMDCDVDKVEMYKCDKCLGERKIEPIVILGSYDDCLCNVDLQRRIEGGIISIQRGVTPDKRTMHYVERNA